MKVQSQAERGRRGGLQPLTELQQNTPLRLRCCLLSFPIGPHNLLDNTSKHSRKKKMGGKAPRRAGYWSKGCVKRIRRWGAQGVGGEGGNGIK